MDLVRASEHDLPQTGPPSGARAFQERNADVATTVAMVLGQRGFRISNAAIGAGIESARLPGRLERMPGTAGPGVWIDGAQRGQDRGPHRRGYPSLCRGPLPVVVFGMLRSKDHRGCSSSFQGRRPS